MMTKRKKSAAHQIFKLHVQVLADGELCVGYGLVKIRVQVVEHLHDRMSLIREEDKWMILCGP